MLTPNWIIATSDIICKLLVCWISLVSYAFLQGTWRMSIGLIDTTTHFASYNIYISYITNLISLLNTDRLTFLYFPGDDI